MGVRTPDLPLASSLAEIIGNELIAPGQYRTARLPFSGTARERLTLDRQYYVRGDGDDNNTGRGDNAAGAFLSLQRAIDVAYNMVDLNGHDVTINVRAGTFAGAVVSNPSVGTGTIKVLGDLGAPETIIIDGGADDAILLEGPAQLTVEGFTAQSDDESALRATNCGRIDIGQGLIFGACGKSHIKTETGGIVLATAEYTIADDADEHFNAESGSLIMVTAASVIIDGSRAFTTFAKSASGSVLMLAGVTWTGAATGIRFALAVAGVIFTNGQALTYLPGSVAGTNDGTGRYDNKYMIAALTDPSADRIPFWDTSAGLPAWLRAHTGLTITGTDLLVSGLTTAEFAANVVDTDGTLAANSDTRLASQKAVKAYVDQSFAANDAMIFKGVIDASANPNYPAADRGHAYRISVAGKIGGGSGPNVEVGDLIICLTDATGGGTHAGVGANWTITQTNLDGAFIGIASSTDGHFVQFDGLSGKQGKGGIALDIDGALAANSDTRLASQKAVKAYVDALGVSLATATPDLTMGGRLTLESGNPYMRTDQVGKQNLYYAPAVGKTVPVLISGSFVPKDIVSSDTDQIGLTLALAGSANWAADSLHDAFAFWNSGTLTLATRLWDAGMFPTETLITPATTITTGTGAQAWTTPSNAFDGITNQAFASSARIAVPSNAGLANFLGQDWGSGVTKIVSKVVITASNNNNLQGGASPALQIVVSASNDGTNWTALGFFYLDVTAFGTQYTIPINRTNRVPYRYHRVGFTGNASFSINVAEIQFYEVTAPANGRRLTKYNGLTVNDASITARIDASTTVSVPQYEATFLGTVHIDAAAAGQITAHHTYGSSRTYGVWNAHNRRRILLRAGVISPGISSYNVTQVRWDIAQAGFSLQALRGLDDERLSASLYRTGYIDASAARRAYESGIGVDCTNSFSGAQGALTVDTTGQALSWSVVSRLTLEPEAGINTLNAIERVDHGASGVVSAFVEARSTVLEAEWLG